MEINIYIELDSMSPKTTEGYYGYVLEWKTKTREGFGKTEGSPAKRLLVALTEALDRIRVDCAVNIFCGNRWAAHALNDDLKHWKENGWKNVRGTEIKHRELWERVPCRRWDERTICNASGARLPDRAKGKMEKYEKEPELKRPDSNVPNTDNGSRETPEDEATGRTGSDFGKREKEPGGWRESKSLLGRVADGISAGMDRDFLIRHYWDEEPDIPRIETGIKHRTDRIKCLGNAVVPQQFYPIFQAIAKIEEKKDDENS